MADFLYRADLLPRGDVYTPYDTGVARVGSVFTLITVVNNNVKPCINREFNPELPLGSAVLYTWPIFHHLCDYFILFFWRKRKRGRECAGFFLFFPLSFFHLKRTSPLGSAVEQRPRILVNSTGSSFPWQFRSTEKNSKKELRFPEVAKEEWTDEVCSVVQRLEET